jgi:hypothetical protein
MNGYSAKLVLFNLHTLMKIIQFLYVIQECMLHNNMIVM